MRKLFFLLTLTTYINASEPVSEPIQIRVLLNEYDTTKNPSFKINSKEKGQVDVVLKNNTIFARNKKGPLKKIKSNVLNITSKNPIHINNKQYNGVITLNLKPKEKKLYLINKLGLEDYVYAVLRAESYPTWPNDMQKIQAIVSRGYAVRQMLEQKKRKNKIYDIKRTTHHQRYDGNHEYKHLRKAVTDTKNIILTHNKKPALTMFDACCGGSVPARMHGINAPYLARKKPCRYCKNYQLFKWQRKLPVKEFLNYLYKYKPIASKLSKQKKLSDIKVVKSDDAGIVKKLRLYQGPGKSATITGKNLWMSMSNIIRSQNFIIKKLGNNIMISGRGFGHQIGLCQRGARELVRLGWPIKKILAFYYPNTKPARLKAG